jgi:mRNA-degrading endonuclease toxin of MazEF toxin-antitoxin module
MRWISDSDHVDCFVSQSRDDVFWDKLGQAIGNLQALERLCIRISTRSYNDHDDGVVPVPHWEKLARILSHVRQEITPTLVSHGAHDPAWRAEDIRSFARVIRGHPTITGFYSGNMSPCEASDALNSALATLPALESLYLSAPPEDGITLANPETLSELLRVPSLQFVCFYRFHFTRTLCHATANALMEGTAVATLKFKECSFSAGECTAIMANGLARNTSVSYVRVERHRDVALFSVLATALHSNSTLLRLDFQQLNDDVYPDLSPLFLALGKNTGLKTLRYSFGSMDESLCTAMQNGLGINETLESLILYHVALLDANLWCKVLPFLRTNKALKSLRIDVERDATESSVSTFCSHIAAMLQENTPLERLTIKKANLSSQS